MKEKLWAERGYKKSNLHTKKNHVCSMSMDLKSHKNVPVK